MPATLQVCLVGLVAYVAAGAFYVLRAQGQSGGLATRSDLRVLVVFALCWMPITICNLVYVYKAGEMRAVLKRFGTETVPPLILFIAIITTDMWNADK